MSTQDLEFNLEYSFYGKREDKGLIGTYLTNSFFYSNGNFKLWFIVFFTDECQYNNTFGTNDSSLVYVFSSLGTYFSYAALRLPSVAFLTAFDCSNFSSDVDFDFVFFWRRYHTPNGLLHSANTYLTVSDSVLNSFGYNHTVFLFSTDRRTGWS